MLSLFFFIFFLRVSCCLVVLELSFLVLIYRLQFLQQIKAYHLPTEAHDIRGGGIASPAIFILINRWDRRERDR